MKANPPQTSVVSVRMSYVREHKLGGVIIWELLADDGRLMQAVSQ